MLKGNKGEWSEVYAFCYLLNSGILKAADKDLNPREDLYFPIIKIIRDYRNKILNYYTGESIKIYDNDTLIYECHKETLIENLTLMLEKIPEGCRAFQIPECEQFLNTIFIEKLKADSQHKQDIDMQIHDVNTGISPVCGFSIKSYLGANPTLINPGKSTNFIYDVIGCNDEIMNVVNSINTRTKIIDRIAYLLENNCMFNCNGVMASSQFKENLEFVDFVMPKILGYALIIAYETGSANGAKRVANVVKKLKERNPVEFSNPKMYEYKIKKFLCACALGMTPEKHWEGSEDANGGYIVVKNDGNVVCYHLYNRTEFEQYLFDYTCFDTPSTSRYDYMHIYKEKNVYKIKLNLQVRFYR